MRNNNKKSVRQSVNELKDILPAEFTNMPTIQLIGSRELTLDGCKGIAEYSDYAVKLKTTCGLISVSGHCLNIKYLSVSSVVIEGKIVCVEFCGRR